MPPSGLAIDSGLTSVDEACCDQLELSLSLRMSQLLGSKFLDGI